MKGQQLTGHGDYTKLVYRPDIPVPRVGNDQVLIRVEACGVNNTDIWTREGAYGQNDDSGWTSLTFPRIQGADVVGTIVQVGSQVPTTIDPTTLSRNSKLRQLKINERAIIYPAIYDEKKGQDITTCRYVGSEVDGGFAEYCVVPWQNVFPISKTECRLSSIDLASFATASMTAYHMVNTARVCSTDTVLVTGASGGVGIALVQLCKLRGAKVIGICGDDRYKINAVKGMGADAIISRSLEGKNLEQAISKAAGETGVNVALDVVGGATLMPVLNVLNVRGRYASAGAIAGPWIRVHWPTFYLKHLTLYGCMLATRQEFGELVELIESNKLIPLVAAVFPLSKLIEAQKFFKAKQFVGKIVIDCKQSDMRSKI